MEAADSDYKRVLGLMCMGADWMTVLRAASDAGAPKCKWLLGLCYLWGIYVDKDYHSARSIFKQGYLSGCKRCEAELIAQGCGSCGRRILYESSVLASGDSYAKGIVCKWNSHHGGYGSHFEAQIEADGDPVSCYIYAMTWEVIKGHELSRVGDLFFRAASAGLAPAQYEYWRIYGTLVGGRRNNGGENLTYLYRAACQGYYGCKYILEPFVKARHAAVLIVLCGYWYDEGCLLRRLPKDIIRIIRRFVLQLDEGLFKYRVGD